MPQSHRVLSVSHLLFSIHSSDISQCRGLLSLRHRPSTYTKLVLVNTAVIYYSNDLAKTPQLPYALKVLGNQSIKQSLPGKSSSSGCACSTWAGAMIFCLASFLGLLNVR